MKTALKSLEYTLECNDNYVEFTYDAENSQVFETILDTFRYKDCKLPKWVSKYDTKYVYNEEPFALDFFIKNRYLKFESEQEAKFFAYLLERHINTIRQLDLNYNIDNITKEVNNYNEID